MEKKDNFFDDFNYGDALVEGLQQALAYAKGGRKRNKTNLKFLMIKGFLWFVLLYYMGTPVRRDGISGT